MSKDGIYTNFGIEGEAFSGSAQRPYTSERTRINESIRAQFDAAQANKSAVTTTQQIIDQGPLSPARRGAVNSTAIIRR